MAVLEDDMTIDDEQLDGPTVEDEGANDSLRQSAAALIRAPDCYAEALSDEDLDPPLADLWRIRRGQATARLSKARRVLGDISGRISAVDAPDVLASRKGAAAAGMVNSGCGRGGRPASGGTWGNRVPAEEGAGLVIAAE